MQHDLKKVNPDEAPVSFKAIPAVSGCYGCVFADAMYEANEEDPKEDVSRLFCEHRSLCGSSHRKDEQSVIFVEEAVYVAAVARSAR